MRLRPQGEEADKDIDQSASLDPKGRTGNGRCRAGRCTGWLTSSGQTEHPGQTCPNGKGKKLDTGAKKGGECEKAQKAVKQRARGGAACGDVRDDPIHKQRRREHQGTEEARVSHRDETEECVKEADQRGRIERR